MKSKRAKLADAESRTVVTRGRVAEEGCGGWAGGGMIVMVNDALLCT